MRSKPPTQRNLPMSIVWHLSLMSMFQVHRIHRERFNGEARVLEPHCRAVKVDQHPLVGVEVEGISELYAVEKRSELRTYERGPGIGGVHVQPESQLLADWSDLLKIVKRARGGCALSSDHAEGDQSSLQILFCRSLQSLSSETEVSIGLEKPHPDSSKQASPLHARVSLLRPVRHQP